MTENAALMSVLADEGGSAPRVGADLRAARERIGYTLEEVAVGLRIRLAYLEALEDGRIGDLPGSAYALGFLRIYAEALGLDGDEISRRFKSEADEINKKTQLDFPAPSLRAGIPAGAMVLLGLVLAVGVYIGWYKLSGDGRLPAEAVAPVPARLVPLAQQAVPPVVAPALSQAVPMRAPLIVPAPDAQPLAPSQAAAAMPLPPPLPLPLAAESVVSAPSLPAAAVATNLVLPPSPMIAAPAFVAPLITPPIPRAIAPVAIPLATPGSASNARIVVRVTADVWIQLRERNGPVIFNRVLKPGETYAVPARPSLLFTTGNAIATEFLVDGVLSHGLGGIKGVRRDLSLDADELRDGRLAAQLGGHPNVTRAQ